MADTQRQASGSCSAAAGFSRADASEPNNRKREVFGLSAASRSTQALGNVDTWEAARQTDAN